MNFISGQLTRNIETAGHAGFCYGVKRAVETTKKIKKENPDKEVFVLGELIHNSSVIKELEELGIKTVETLPPSAPKGAICIIRSHGEGIDTIEKIKNSGYEVVDLTCLDVKKVQDTAVNLAGEGYFLLILGKAEHPEVMAIKSNAKKYSKDINSPLVIKSLEDLISKSDLIKNKNKIGVVIQTTQRIDKRLDDTININIAKILNEQTMMRKEMNEKFDRAILQNNREHKELAYQIAKLQEEQGRMYG